MIKLFREKRISDAFNIVRRNILNKVNRISEYDIVHSDIDSLANEISNIISIKPIQIDFESRKVTVDMVEIPWNHFPIQFSVMSGKSYPCARVTYSFPITSGDKELLSVVPQSSFFDKDVRARVNSELLIIEYQTLYGSIELSDQIKSEIKKFIGEIVTSMKSIIPIIEREVSEFNETIYSIASDLIQQRKDMIQASQNQNNELNDF